VARIDISYLNVWRGLVSRISMFAGSSGEDWYLASQCLQDRVESGEDWYLLSQWLQERVVRIGISMFAGEIGKNWYFNVARIGISNGCRKERQGLVSQMFAGKRGKDWYLKCLQEKVAMSGISVFAGKSGISQKRVLSQSWQKSVDQWSHAATQWSLQT